MKRDLSEQLSSVPIVSTADHAGLLNFGLLFNANLLFSQLISVIGARTSIVLATAQIPLGNASYPNGFFFKGVKRNFFRRKLFRVSTALLPYGIEGDSMRGLESIVDPRCIADLSSGERDFLEHLFFGELRIAASGLGGSPFVRQIGVLNERLWPMLFDIDQRDKVPELHYSILEDAALSLILDDISDRDSTIYRILFDERYRGHVIKELYGIPYCWSGMLGTYFFWGVGPSSSLVRMEMDGIVLREEERGRVAVQMTPEAIRDALGEGRIVPGAFLNLLALGFVEGYTLLGGFNQIEYMGAMKAGLSRALRSVGDVESAEACESRVTDGFICGPMPIRCGSAIDLLWERNSHDGKFLGSIARGVTEAELASIRSMSMRELVESGVEAMASIVE